jgi:polysaccharide pyruvyl transferase WcaK-like protein
MKRKIVFAGGYTIWSAGDDAPMAFLSSRLRERFPGECEFVVIARHPNPVFDEFFGVRTIRGFEYDSKALSSGKWMRGLNFSDDRMELKAIADEIASADLLVLGAGNFITELSLDILRGHFAQFAVLTLLADLAQTPVMLFGLSANKLLHPWSQRAAAWMLRRASAVTFRERLALDNLRASGVKLPHHEILPDAALGAPSAPQARAHEILAGEGIRLDNKEVLAVSVRDLSWMQTHTSYQETLIGVVNAWTARPDRAALFIPQCTYHVEDPRTDDRYTAEQLRPGLVHVGRCCFVRGQYQSPDIACLYHEAHVTLATRLHGSVFSAKAGTPVVGLSYEDKVAGFFGQLGRPEWALSLQTDPTNILSLLDHLSARQAALRPELLARVGQLTHELERYVDIACELVLRAEPAQHRAPTETLARREAIPGPGVTTFSRS